jgi:hypothetical protein
MAMFLESNNISYKEVENTDSVLAILEDFMDLTLEIAAFTEGTIQEEYNILTEDAEEPVKEGKKSGLLEKIKRFFIEFYRKIIIIIGRVKQKLISIFKGKKDKNIKIYKSYHDYFITVFDGIADVLADSAKSDTLIDWLDEIRFASKDLSEDEVIEVNATVFDKMISDMENFSKVATEKLKKLEEESATSEFIMNLNRWDTRKCQEVLKAITRSLALLPKSFPKE